MSPSFDSTKRTDLVEVEVPVDDCAENPCERAVIELEEAEHVEVSQQTRCDVVSPTAGRPHRADNHRVHDRLPSHVLQIVPSDTPAWCGSQRAQDETNGRLSCVVLYINSKIPSLREGKALLS